MGPEQLTRKVPKGMVLAHTVQKTCGIGSGAKIRTVSPLGRHLIKGFHGSEGLYTKSSREGWRRMGGNDRFAMVGRIYLNKELLITNVTDKGQTTLDSRRTDDSWQHVGRTDVREPKEPRRIQNPFTPWAKRAWNPSPTQAL